MSEGKAEIREDAAVVIMGCAALSCPAVLCPAAHGERETGKRGQQGVLGFTALVRSHVDGVCRAKPSAPSPRASW